MITSIPSSLNIFYCAYHVLVQSNCRRYNFHFLPDQAQILLHHFNVLDELWCEISGGFENKWIYNVAESGQFLQWGSMGKIFICCRIHLKFCVRVCLKRLNDGGEFELDRAKRKNNISENLVALGYDFIDKHMKTSLNWSK